MRKNDRLQRLYNISEASFISRIKRHEEMKHTLDDHQLRLDEILLKREKRFYRGDPCPDATDCTDTMPKDDTCSSLFGKGPTLPISFPVLDQEKRLKHTRKNAIQGARLPFFFACNIEGCCKRYMSSSGLKYHIREGHSEKNTSSPRPFVCPYADCRKKYKNSNGLKYHIGRSHDG
jgi:hypothetical protein